MTEYTCEMCGGTFVSDWSDEDAHAEAKGLFGDLGTDVAVICDDCFHEKVKPSLTNE